MSTMSSPLTHSMARELARQLQREDARAARRATLSRRAAGPGSAPASRVAADAPVAAVCPAPLRLTRRGRLTVFLATLTVALLAAIAFGATSAATDEPGAPVPATTVVVGSGDTLWGIATTVAEPGETQAMVRTIMELNALDDAALDPGQRLRVPAAG